MIMATKKKKSKGPVRPRPLSPKAGVTKNRYAEGGKVAKKKP